MKRTLLTQAQLQLLEQALVAHGDVVAFADLAGLLPDRSDAYRRTFIKGLADAGWLVRLKRGVYQIAELSSLGAPTLSRFAIAQILVPDSYVSFESAWQHWGLYDQLPATVTSVALRQYAPVGIEGMRYRFVKTTPAYYYGWQMVEISHRQVRMAQPEKALIDMVQFHRSRLSLSLVAEKLATERGQFDFDRLQAFLLQANLTTLRICGWLLDAVGVDTARLHERARAATSVSQATPQAVSYAAKWRLYVDPAMMIAQRPTHQAENSRHDD
jgi:predicted transcriptional regulator of viral defense system